MYKILFSLLLSSLVGTVLANGVPTTPPNPPASPVSTSLNLQACNTLMTSSSANGAGSNTVNAGLATTTMGTAGGAVANIAGGKQANIQGSTSSVTEGFANSTTTGAAAGQAALASKGSSTVGVAYQTQVPNVGTMQQAANLSSNSQAAFTANGNTTGTVLAGTVNSFEGVSKLTSVNGVVSGEVSDVKAGQSVTTITGNLGNPNAVTGGNVAVVGSVVSNIGSPVPTVNTHCPLSTVTDPSQGIPGC